MDLESVESHTTEFKSSWRDEYLKWICAFANTDGGRLLIGVDDNGKPVGVEDSKKLLEDLPNKLRDTLGIIPSVRLEKENGKEIIIIEVEHSYVPISYHGRFYVRSGSTIQELKGKDLTRFLISNSGKHWEEYIEENASIEDINNETIEKLKQIAIKRIPLVKDENEPIKVLEKLNLIKNGKLTRAALLLFGKNPKRFWTSSYIKVGKFLTDTDIISSDDIEGNLFEQVEKTMELLRTKYLISEIRFEGIYRKEELEYPEEALREAIINSVIHRDYIGPHTQLKIYPDKIILWNVGTLPKEIKVDELKKNHSSYPRNELLADVFFKAGLIEAWGRGTIKITDECKKAGLPEPEFKEEFGGFAVYFYKDIYTEDNLRKMGLNERQIKAVKYVKEKGKITNKEYQELNKTSKPTATRDLRNLVDKGIVIMQGEAKRQIYYQLSQKRANNEPIEPKKSQ
ncbi:putative transcriptional regulator [Petrotoga mobilis SJ95]|uniref:Transcriptional regulator n=2 Tax=Petrotoga TaxID=28236 RepID=A9BGB0_PETMO|nr:putative transcriptional regulator [Petrotoga mobilis SJ95]